ncbi:hypothetical protein KVV02_001924 [Mortierella alpina]|uniref:ABC transmembrane type-1 domain-containing protein n=1 Tax=Mortierella alpina TaxID=64518 RepID=A0A9P8AAK9_MORAP|nr:hypothetical protein KVV02_001924 [Mortierella alpina]
MGAFCDQNEGWGPTSHNRTDLTPCVEDTILLGLPALVGFLGFACQVFTMWRSGKPHNLGRTNIIYWPSQLLMLASAVALVARAAVLSKDGHAPATLFATICMIAAWLCAPVLNYFQHEQEVRSNDFIFGMYFFSVVASAINIRTMTLLHQTDQDQFKAFVAFLAINLLGFTVEAWPRGSTEVQRKSGGSRYSKANLFSRLSFHFMQPIVSAGFKTPLTAKDIVGMMPVHIKTQYSHERLNAVWQAHAAKHQARGTKPSLLLTILKAYGWSWVPVLSYRIASSALTYVLPQLLNELLAFIGSFHTPNPKPLEVGIILAFGMFFASLLCSFCMAQAFQVALNLGIEARTALIAMIYRKSLKLSSAAKQKSTAGEINNHMSVDSERWSEALVFMPMFISIPIELIIAIWMLYQQISWSVFVGLGTIIILTPVQGIIAKFFMKAKAQKLEAMDGRIRIMNEILSGIKIVKLYGWEESFRDRVNVYRRREVATLRRIGVIFSFLSIMFSSIPLLVALVSFAVYATVGGQDFGPGEISAQRVFVSISLFGMLNRPIGMLSHLIAEAIGLLVATRRIQKFLLAEEIAESTTESIKTLPEDPTIPVIEITNGTFAWETEGPEVETEKEKRRREKLENRKYKQLVKEARKAGKPIPEKDVSVEKDYGPTLTDINLAIARGSLAAVVGRVGQGKTSLLNAIIGDMYRREGHVRVYGNMAYVAQQAWIVNATLKDNIVFGNVFDQAKYDHIIMACGLLPDIAMLPAGETGKYNALMANKDAFYQLITDYSVNQGKQHNSDEKNGAISDSEDEDETTQDGGEKASDVIVKKDDKAELIAEEKVVIGSVSWNVYKIYAKAASYKWSIAVVILFVTAQAVQIGTNLWLKHWASVAGTGEDVGMFLGVYGALIFVFMLLNVGSSYVAMVLAAIRASTRLHDRLLTTMMRLPMSFFDTTPLGRIVNRFSSDFFGIDELTPWNFINVLVCGSSVLGTIVVIATTTPVFLAIVPPLIVIYLLVQAYYIRSSRALKRIDSVSKSPIYQHFSETLTGVSTIRALGASDRFIAANAAKADIAANAMFSWVVSNRWLQIRLETLGAFIVLAAALFAVLGRETLSSGNVGLALSYALSVTLDITWLVRSYCDLQNQLVAVERVDEYASKNPEAPAETDVQLPENWPQAGRVEFKNYSTRYREGLDLVIKNISFEPLGQG